MKTVSPFGVFVIYVVISSIYIITMIPVILYVSVVLSCLQYYKHKLFFVSTQECISKTKSGRLIASFLLLKKILETQCFRCIHFQRHV